MSFVNLFLTILRIIVNIIVVKGFYLAEMTTFILWVDGWLVFLLEEGVTRKFELSYSRAGGHLDAVHLAVLRTSL